MGKNTGKVREFCQSGKVGTLILLKFMVEVFARQCPSCATCEFYDIRRNPHTSGILCSKSYQNLSSDGSRISHWVVLTGGHQSYIMPISTKNIEIPVLLNFYYCGIDL